jgi:hypothetical protein
MTARGERARRLRAAAAAAARADDWIGDAKRQSDLAVVLGPADAARFGRAMLKIPRVSRRFPGYATELASAIQQRPALGAFLASPEALQRLALFAGAGAVGGGMVRFVNRRSVSELVAALGGDVWAYGVEHGAAPITAVRNEDDAIDRVASDGTRAVYVFLENVCPGLGSDACAAAGLAPGSTSHPQEQEALSAAVDGALEHAAP